MWKQWIEIGRHTREQVRESGFGPATEGLIVERLTPLSMVESSHELACNLLDFVLKESRQLPDGENAPGTTEVIELFIHDSMYKLSINMGGKFDNL